MGFFLKLEFGGPHGWLFLNISNLLEHNTLYERFYSEVDSHSF